MATEAPALVAQVIKLSSLDRPRQCILYILHHLLEDDVIQGAHHGCVYLTRAGVGGEGWGFSMHEWMNTSLQVLLYRIQPPNTEHARPGHIPKSQFSLPADRLQHEDANA